MPTCKGIIGNRNGGLGPGRPGHSPWSVNPCIRIRTACLLKAFSLFAESPLDTSNPSSPPFPFSPISSSHHSEQSSECDDNDSSSTNAHFRKASLHDIDDALRVVEENENKPAAVEKVEQQQQQQQKPQGGDVNTSSAFSTIFNVPAETKGLAKAAPTATTIDLRTTTATITTRRPPPPRASSSSSSSSSYQVNSYRRGYHKNTSQSREYSPTCGILFIVFIMIVVPPMLALGGIHILIAIDARSALPPGDGVGHHHLHENFRLSPPPPTAAPSSVDDYDYDAGSAAGSHSAMLLLVESESKEHSSLDVLVEQLQSR